MHRTHNVRRTYSRTRHIKNLDARCIRNMCLLHFPVICCASLLYKLIYTRCFYNLTVVEEVHGSTSVAFSRNIEICAYLTHMYYMNNIFRCWQQHLCIYVWPSSSLRDEEKANWNINKVFDGVRTHERRFGFHFAMTYY